MSGAYGRWAPRIRRLLPNLDSKLNKKLAPRANARLLLDTVLAGDREAALTLCLAAQVATGTRVGVFVDLLQPAQYEVGELWYRGEIQVADEHRATAVVEWVTERLPATVTPEPVPPGRGCLLAVMGAEQHRLGLRQLELALQDDGWAVEVVPRSVAAAELADRTRAAQPNLVCISAGYLPDAEPVRQGIALVHQMGLPVLVGGPSFNRDPGLWRRLGADHHGTDARMALVMARRLLR